LHELSSRELANFLNGETGWGGDLEISPARDWTNIRERMRYIVQLFRVMHLEQSVFSEPYVLPQGEPPPPFATELPA
jgi:hypothetical protein